jgi:hypothetical protein
LKPSVRAAEVPAIAPPTHDHVADKEEVLGVATEVGVGPFATPTPVTPVTPVGAAAGALMGGLAIPTAAGETELCPTLFLGLGGLACWTLRHLRQRLHNRFGSLAAVPAVRLLLLDTDRAGIQLAQQGEAGEALELEETLLVPLGTGLDSNGGPGRVATPLALALGDQARVLEVDLSRSLVEWLLSIVEDPRRRLKAAEHAAQWFLQHFLETAENTRTQLTQSRTHRGLRLRRLITGDFATPGSGLRWLGRRRTKEAPNEPSHQCLEYGWLCLRELFLENILEIVGFISGQIGEFLQGLALCQRRLGLFAETFRPALPASPVANDRPVSIPGRTELLPGQSNNLAEAVEAILKHLEPDFTLHFDEDFQREVLSPHGGLWGLVSGDSAVTKELKDELQRRARSAILKTLEDNDAATLFLESQRGPGRATQALSSPVAAAVPRLLVPEGWHHLVLALPKSQAGALLGDMVTEAFPDVSTTRLESEGDVILCQEAAHLPIHQVAIALLGEEGVYPDNARRVMTRLDVTWSSLAPGTSREEIRMSET